MVMAAIKNDGAGESRSGPLDPTKQYLFEISRLGRPLDAAEQRRLTCRVSANVRKCIGTVIKRCREAERTCRALEHKKNPTARSKRAAADHAMARAMIARLNPDGLSGRKLNKILVRAVHDNPVRLLEEFVSAKAAEDFRRLTECNLRLVIRYARDYNKRCSLTLNELIQEGNIGLMTGIARFDARRGFQLSTFVSWWIKHHIRRAIDDKADVVRMPVHQADLISRIRRTVRELQKSLNRPPTREDVAEAMAKEELTKKLKRPPSPAEAAAAKDGCLKRILKADSLTVRFVSSLNREIGHEDGRQLIDIIENDPDRVPAADERIYEEQKLAELRRATMRLDPRIRRIIELRFGLAEGDEALTLKEIGGQFGLSRERIRQIETQALKRLKNILIGRGMHTP